MDVTVVMTEAATTPGFALDYAFGNKRRTARPKQLPLPSVAESLCGWHNGAKREVKKLGAAGHTGQEEGEAISHLWGRLAYVYLSQNVHVHYVQIRPDI